MAVMWPESGDAVTIGAVIPAACALWVCG